MAQGTAHAATPAADTYGPGNGDKTFTGQVLITNFAPNDPVTNSPCLPQAADPGNGICEHYTANVTVPGNLQACVSFDQGDFGLNDIDLYLAGPDGTVVASATGDGNPECVSFDVPAAGNYELQINPAFLEGPGQISGHVTFAAMAQPGVKTAQTPGPEMEGNGKVTDALQFEEKLAEFEPKENKLHVESKDQGPCKFKATSFDVVDIQGTITSSDGKHGNGAAHASGSGINYNHPVTWTVDITDGGDGNANGDTFTFSTNDGCSVSGPLTQGNVEYEISN